MARARANRTVSENRAISQTIDRLRLKGLPRNRAEAAAFRMFREGELGVLIANIRAQQRKTKQEVALEKAMIAAADLLRKRREEQQRRQKRAELLARRARLAAKKSGQPETVEEMMERLRIERAGELSDRTRRRQI